MSRPRLNTSLSREDFLAYYWLKRELTDFCRAKGLASSGSKAELTERVAHFLETGKPPTSRTKTVSRGVMPEIFTKETVIGEGWRCTQALRRFFERETERQFHFNGFLRDYITQSGVGHTLGEAIDGWHASKGEPEGSSRIGEQFEYNQHMRDYFRANPGASREAALKAWRKRRGERSE